MQNSLVTYFPARFVCLRWSNGAGLDTSGKRNSVGLNNIFERADYLDGVATINSSPGNGVNWQLALNTKKVK
ncbi:MAG: hypothetical protein ABIO76_12500 [Ginsengibacter sp.]